jgi:hypothetical protein
LHLGLIFRNETYFSSCAFFLLLIPIGPIGNAQ